MGLNISSLVIETTRRCNLSCEHCLRGDAEDKVLAPEHLDALFSRLDYVGNVTFTGGEPSLAPEVISQTLDVAEKYGVGIGSFYIATNAVATSDEFLMVIARLWCYCDENDEVSGVHWSNDDFHPDMERSENTRKLSMFKFAGPKYGKGGSSTVINEGRGENFGEDRYNDREHFDVDDDCVGEGTVYLNCEGNIVGGCDWSFESQRDPENIVSTVAEFSIEKIEEFIEAGEE